jgi:hypothetical protein
VRTHRLRARPDARPREAHVKRSLVLLVLAVLAACDGQRPATTRADTPAVEPRPASLVRALPPADARTLRFRLTAPAAHPLHLENCNGAFSWGLERRVAGDWARAWTVATDACHSAPIVIPPRDSRTFEEAVTLHAGERLPAGTYRIVVHGLYAAYAEDHAAGAEVPNALRVSAPFELGPLEPR